MHKYTKTLATTVFFLSVFSSTGVIANTTSENTTAESRMLIDDLVRQIETTMVAVSKIESQAGRDANDLHLSLAIPAKVSTNLGMILDINDDNGFRVLNTSADSFSHSLGLEANDLIKTINDVGTTSPDRKQTFALLENLSPGDTVSFKVARGSQDLQMSGDVIGVYTPAIHIELGSSAASTKASTQKDDEPADSNACGKVSTFFNPPQTRDLYNTYITQIGEENVNRGKESFRLSPGTHEVHVHELIGSRAFRRTRAIQRAKPIIIEVEANTTYYLAAKYIPKNRYKIHDEEFWEPVVWKVRENATCRL